MKHSTGGSQQPWVSSSPIDGSFYFVAAPTSLTKPSLNAAPSQTNEAAQAWAATKETTNPAVLEAFMQRYGDSFYSNLARARLDDIKAAVTKSPQVASIPPLGDASPKSMGPNPARQRVVLYDEDPSDQKGKQYVGSVIWRTEQVKPSAGQKADLAVRADIEVPDRKFKMTISFRRNTDTSLPASHTAELTFILPPDFDGGGVGNVPGILMKSNEQALGTPLVGLTVKVTDGFFMVGLSNVQADRARNLQLLRERSWFDVSLVYANQRRAIVAIEKGMPGNQAFGDAFSAWGQSSVANRLPYEGLKPSPGAQISKLPATTVAKPDETSKPPAIDGDAATKRTVVFPTAVSPNYSSEDAGKARMHTCVDQYNANKVTNSNGGLLWIQQGD